MKKIPLIVTSPVANLRKEPVEAPFSYIHDDLQETQLLYNEILICNEKRGDWYNIEAIEQKKAYKGSWRGQSGWVRKESVTFLDTVPIFNAVVKNLYTVITDGPDDTTAYILLAPMGTRLVTEDEGDTDYLKTALSDGRQGWVSKKAVNTTEALPNMRQLRENIVETARLFLDMPYLWGGRSAHIPLSKINTGGAMVTGVDCSGLTNLVYRVQNLGIPRDACDQRVASRHIASDVLEAADLIFLSAEGHHDNITHVMLYMGDGKFIEASETGTIVAVDSFEKRFGIKLHDIAAESFIVDKKKIIFASMLGTGDKK